jgi:hypothetical protein
MAVSLGFGIVISGFMVLFVTPAVAVVIDDLRGHERAKDTAGSSSLEATTGSEPAAAA